MTVRAKVIFATLWVLSIVVTARWSASAQTPTAQLGHEVRFMRSEHTVTGHRGILVANINGQWLPVELDTLPDGNSLIPGPQR